ncbi:MAG: tRNA preQ1(34) S-adenosylmethionine ribosyltransferase-isomerase QueA [Phycisphaerae bacterium]
MRKSELIYVLPSELIAQQPADRRDESRLLVLHRDNDRIEHTTFANIARYVPPGSLLVLNDTRVVPARYEARRATGGRISGLFIREIAAGQWETLLQGRGRLRVGQELTLGGGAYRATLTDRGERGLWQVRITPADPAETILEHIGRTPLPPYIRRAAAPAEADRADRQRYQTIYATHPGAVAAPTAGLHFSEGVFDSLRAGGAEWVRVTLHVGLGTFAPITADDLAGHTMHAEWYSLPAAAAERINAARAAGRRVIAVGTTAARVLETCADERGVVRAATGWTDLFIYPPYRFRAVDAMVTNFHLPGSTLLAMIYAFAGADRVRRAYADAIARKYRFYSYGDAMLIL